MKNNINILFTSVGRRSYLVEYFKEELKGRGNVIASNSDAYTTAMKVADKSYITPLIYSKEYIPFLLDICKKENIKMLISLFDIDLPILAKHKEEFKKLGVIMVISDLEIVDICNDKLKMCEFLGKYGFAVSPIVSHLPMIQEENSDFIKGFAGGKQYILKPRWGMGSLGMFTAENIEELMVFYKKARREIQKSYLRFEAEKDIEHSIIIQEKFIGTEYGLDIINDLEGNYITTVVKRKLTMRAGETDIAQIVQDSILESLGEKLSKILRHIGNLDVDIIRTDNGDYIIDMNARFGGGYPFSHSAGIQLPKALMEWCQGKEASKDCFTFKIGGIYAKNLTIEELGK